MALAGELAAADFIFLVTRRLALPSPTASPLTAAAAEALLERAVTCANRYAAREERAGLRALIAEAAESAAGRPEVTPPVRRMLESGFAASAQSDGQLARLRAWLDSGEATDAALRGKIAAALSARGLAGDADLAALAAADPVSGEATLLTCRALRPEADAKEQAWRAALDESISGRLAIAHAEGVWAPGQEELMTGYLERYFGDALPALNARDARGDWPVQRVARRLAWRLFPSFLDPAATLAAIETALAAGLLTEPMRTVLLVEQAGLRSAAAASGVPARFRPS
jgi:aminopeptidase N